MTQTIDKSLVTERFRKRMANYSQYANVQTEMARQLIGALSAQQGKIFPRTLEIGCGAGNLTRLIGETMEVESFFTNDLIAECKAVVEQVTDLKPDMSSQFIAGDIESDLSLPGNLNLIISNATFQWMSHLDSLLIRLKDILCDKGILAFSTFGPDNFLEIRELTGTTLIYLSAQSIENLLRRHFRILHQSESRTTLRFPSPLDVVQHIRHTGTNALKRERWKPSSLQKFLKSYRELWSVGEEVSLTYHPITFIAEKC